MNIKVYSALVGLNTLMCFSGCEQMNESRATQSPSAVRTDALREGTELENKHTAMKPIPTRTETEADNTAKNEADRSGETKTPFDQSESNDNIQITAQIRRAIMNDGDMSTNAQNSKIVTDKSGLVTLRGPVDSHAEKDSIVAKAKAVAGVTHVDNQLEVTID